jgi:hypothetical protein
MEMGGYGGAAALIVPFKRDTYAAVIAAFRGLARNRDRLGESTDGKPPVVMIHGAFVGPWAMEDFAGKFRDAGYAGAHALPALSRRGQTAA